MVERLEVSGQIEGKESEFNEPVPDPQGQSPRNTKRGATPILSRAVKTGQGVGTGDAREIQASAQMRASAWEVGGQGFHGTIWNREQNLTRWPRVVWKQRHAWPPGRRQGASGASSTKNGEFNIHETSLTQLVHNGRVEWTLPPQLPWPQFLRLLRHPSPPKGWLEAAAELPDVQKRPALLRWIAQHRKTPMHLRAHLLPRLSIRALCDIAGDASAHPQARTMANDRLQGLWGGITSGERRALALHAPRQLWPSIWKVRDLRIIASFLQNPRLGYEPLVALIQAPLSAQHAEALTQSRWREIIPVAHQVLLAMDQTFRGPDCMLVLGHAAPWIRALPMDERLVASARIVHPPLRRMTRAWALPEPD